MVIRPATTPRPARVLVVEDNLSIAKLCASLLTDLGHTTVGPAPSNAKARVYLDSTHIDVALLDVSVADGPVFPLAADLRSRGIPFVFCTGYDAKKAIPVEFRDACTLMKPYEPEDLVEALTISMAAGLATRR